MTDAYSIKLRPLEREDLRFVHQLDNNASVMRYWFEEPYEAFVELSDLYDKHIHDQSERRFVIECNGEKPGWWSWLRSTTSIAAPNSKSSFHRIIRKRSGDTRGEAGDGLWFYGSQSVQTVSHRRQRK